MLKVFDDIDALSRAAAERIVKAAEAAVAREGRFDLVLSGGSTPEATYWLLAGPSYRDRECWGRTHVFWGDERCVPPDHEASNYRMADEALLEGLPVPARQVYRIPAEAADLDAALRQYERVLPPMPDLLLLGMGSDGHTASLFPHSPAIDERDRRLVAVEADAAPRRRVTITPPVIGAARRRLVLVAGASKAEALTRVFAEQGDVHDTPARLARDGTWFVDAAAAARLASP